MVAECILREEFVFKLKPQTGLLLCQDYLNLIPHGNPQNQVLNATDSSRMVILEATIALVM